jgi:hypothetical protein
MIIKTVDEQIRDILLTCSREPETDVDDATLRVLLKMMCLVGIQSNPTVRTLSYSSMEISYVDNHSRTKRFTLINNNVQVN